MSIMDKMRSSGYQHRKELDEVYSACTRLLDGVINGIKFTSRNAIIKLI